MNMSTNFKKKADVKISPLIKLILVVLVVVIVFVGVFSFDMLKFFKGLPDFFRGDSRPESLYADAVIYGVNVRILKNDGEGRCVVAEVPEYGGEDNEWLKSYGVRRGELEIDKKVVETMDWVSGDIIERLELFKKLKEDEYYLVSDILHDIDAERTYVGGQIIFPNNFIRTELNKVTNDEGWTERFLDNLVIEDALLVEGIKLLDKMAFTNKPVLMDVLFTFLDKREGVFGETVISLKLIEGNLKFFGERHFFQSVENPFFALRNEEIYFSEDGENWESYQDRIEEDLVKNQQIKQDLMKACYSEERDFKETKILEKPVTLVLSDEDFGGEGRCFVYKSEEDRELEHYAIKYSFGGTLLKRAKLYWLNSGGNWEIIDTVLPSPDEIEIIPLMQNLILEEKKFSQYIVEKYEYFCPGFLEYRLIGLVEPGSFAEEYDICKSGGEVEKVMREIYANQNLVGLEIVYNDKQDKTMQNEINNYDLGSYVFTCNQDSCFVTEKSNDKFRVRDGKIYELQKTGILKKIRDWKPIITEKDYRYAYLSVEDWGELLRKRSIKLGLINECKR